MLKKGIRILGLTATPEQNRRMHFVGAVMRGSMWLDAAFVCTIDKGHRNFAPPLARSIMQTKQFPQLHAVITSGEYCNGHYAEIVSLADKIKLPVMALVERGTPKPTRNLTSKETRGALKSYTLKMNNREVCVRTARISQGAAYEIFKVSCPPGGHVPEAVRVAKVLADHISSSQNTRNKKITRRTFMTRRTS